MFNFNLSIKKLKNLLLSINKLIESFFDNFRPLNKHNLSKKKRLRYLDNRIAISIGSVVILFFCYFLIPTFFNKNEVKAFLKNQIYNEFDIDVKFNDKIKYGLFPRPYFYTHNLEINHDEKYLAKSDYVKIYISFNNFFSMEKIKVKDLVFKKTEFRTNSKNINFFLKFDDTNLDQKKITFVGGKLFFENKDNDILFLSRIKKFNFFKDKKKLQRKMIFNYEIFNVPFILNITSLEDSNDKIVVLKSKKIRLDVKTTLKKKEKNYDGLINLLIFNQDNSFTYKYTKNTFEFLSVDKNYSGLINFKPFYFLSDLSFNELKKDLIFKNDSLIMALIDTGLLNNQNLNANLNFSFNKIDKNDYLKDLLLRVSFEQGKILINNSNINWNNSALIKLNNIQLMNIDNEKKINGEIAFDFNDIDNVYRYYQIKRNYRNRIKDLVFDFEYNLNSKKIFLSNLKINNESKEQLNIFLSKFNSKENNIFNKVTFRNFVKEFFRIYAG